MGLTIDHLHELPHVADPLSRAILDATRQKRPPTSSHYAASAWSVHRGIICLRLRLRPPLPPLVPPHFPLITCKKLGAKCGRLHPRRPYPGRRHHLANGAVSRDAGVYIRPGATG